jgi:hypothetical protein
VASSDPALAEAPVRQPTRKIFGPDNKVITLAERRPAAKPPQASTEVVSKEPSSSDPLLEAIRSESSKPPQIDLSVFSAPSSSPSPSVTIPMPSLAPSSSAPYSVPATPYSGPAIHAPEAQAKVAWDALPSSISKELRTTLTSLREQCESAAHSPFPFAKFLAAIPHELCAEQFAALLLDVEPDTSPDAIAQKLGKDSASIASLLSDAAANLSDLFAQKCPVMYRNWKAQLAGRVVSAQALMEQHIIGTVNPEFQVHIAQVVLRAFGVKTVKAPSKVA